MIDIPSSACELNISRLSVLRCKRLNGSNSIGAACSVWRVASYASCCNGASFWPLQNARMPCRLDVGNPSMDVSFKTY